MAKNKIKVQKLYFDKAMEQYRKSLETVVEAEELDEVASEIRLPDGTVLGYNGSWEDPDDGFKHYDFFSDKNEEICYYGPVRTGK